eukprot:scaffold6701_cov19-Tisochrysis_lutea.AAC.3
MCRLCTPKHPTHGLLHTIVSSCPAIAFPQLPSLNYCALHCTQVEESALPTQPNDVRLAAADALAASRLMLLPPPSVPSAAHSSPPLPLSAQHEPSPLPPAPPTHPDVTSKGEEEGGAAAALECACLRAWVTTLRLSEDEDEVVRAHASAMLQAGIAAVGAHSCTPASSSSSNSNRGSIGTAAASTCGTADTSPAAPPPPPAAPAAEATCATLAGGLQSHDGCRGADEGAGSVAVATAAQAAALGGLQLEAAQRAATAAMAQRFLHTHSSSRHSCSSKPDNSSISGSSDGGGSACVGPAVTRAVCEAFCDLVVDPREPLPALLLVP